MFIVKLCMGYLFKDFMKWKVFSSCYGQTKWKQLFRGEHCVTEIHRPKVLPPPFVDFGWTQPTTPIQREKKNSRSTMNFFCNMSWVCIVVVVHLFPSSHPASFFHFMRCFKRNLKVSSICCRKPNQHPILLSISYIHLRCCDVCNGNIMELNSDLLIVYI